MAASVATIDLTATADQFRMLIEDQNINTVRVSHPETGDKNLIRVAYRNDVARDMITRLATNNFCLYMHAEGESRFVRFDHIPNMWHRIKNGEFKSSSDGLVYSYSPPKVASGNTKLLVIFSSMSADVYTPSLLRHFTRNFPKAQTFMTPQTGVLRIADFGGVVGGFYLPTTADPDAGVKVLRLIEEVTVAESIARNDVVLYGASKGGTAAIYHGLSAGIPFVAVDPVVSDEYYESAYRDSHFTGSGVFPESKQITFKRVVSQAKSSEALERVRGRAVVICSERSPQYKYIENVLINELANDVFFLNSQHPEIMDHPDVAPKTVAWATMALNMNLNHVPIGTGLRTVI